MTNSSGPPSPAGPPGAARPPSGDLGTDPDAFEVFYRQHIDEVQRFVARRVDDPELAADLTADIFLAVIEAADGYRPELGSPVAWLFGIAHNVVNGHHRRRARETAALQRLAGRRLLDADGLERVREKLDAQAAARALRPALDGLSGGERAVFELVALDGLSVADAARALGVQPVAARVRLYRARRHMSSSMAASLATLAGPDRPAPGDPATTTLEVSP